MEGYLPRKEFSAQLELALGRIAFVHKQWAEAESRYNEIVSKCADTASAAEAMYWAAVSHYKKTNDHTVLGSMSQQLAQKFPDGIWTEKASVWLPAASQTKTA
jgi:outer membrane protein assembly factor BamD (BamD/ComL family)